MPPASGQAGWSGYKNICIYKNYPVYPANRCKNFIQRTHIIINPTD
jgi:hypothetical protein